MAHVAMEDRTEAVLKELEHSSQKNSNLSALQVFTLVSIIGSLALFISGRKLTGIFVGLWPPTIQALRSTLRK